MNKPAAGAVKDFLFNKQFYSDLWRIAVPITIQNILSSSLHLIDTAMILRLGDNEAAAVGMAGRWFFLLNIIMFGVSSGSAIIMSQYWGIRDRGHIRSAYGLGIVNCVGISLLIQFFMMIIPGPMMIAFAGGEQPQLVQLGVEYMKYAAFGCVAIAFNTITTTVLRSTEQVKLPLFTGFVSVIANTFLNYCLIYGNFGFPRMGVAGAALATVISHWLQFVLLIAISRYQRNIVWGSIKELFAFEKAFVKKYYKMTAWVIFNESLWVVGTNIYNMVFGRLGATNYAAYSLFSTVEGLCFSMFVGCGNACVVMVGSEVGSGDYKDAKRDSSRFIMLSVVCAVLIGSLIVLLRNPIVSLMTPNTETASIAARILLIYGIGMPVRLLPYILIVGIFRSGGNPKISAFLDTVPLYVIGIPIVFITGSLLKLPIEYVYLGQIAEELAKCIIGLPIFFKGSWMRNITDRDKGKELIEGGEAQ